MKNNQKGHLVTAVVLFLIGGILIIFNIISFYGAGLLQDDIEQSKENAVAVEGVVDDLRYDSTVRHYVADVVYEVDGEYYIVTLDNATSNNKPGTTMTVYYSKEDPSRVVDEMSTRETLNTYKFIIIGFAVGIVMITGSFISITREKQRLLIQSVSDNSTPASSTSQIYTGYNSAPSPSSYNLNAPYGQNNYAPNTPYGQ